MALTASWPAPWYTESMICCLFTAMSSAWRTRRSDSGLGAVSALEHRHDVVGDVAQVETGLVRQFQVLVVAQRLEVGRTGEQGDLAFVFLSFWIRTDGSVVMAKIRLSIFTSSGFQ